MSACGVTTLEMRAIERVLGMGDGYVLDFTDQSFSAFFAEHGVDIDGVRFRTEGGSKAKRLRCFLRTESAPLVGRVLAGLVEHRLASGGGELPPSDLESYCKTIERLGGRVPSTVSRPGSATTAAPAEEDLLRRVFDPNLFARLPVGAAMTPLLVARMEEARRCIEAQAYLAAVMLCGSVVEGMCLGLGAQHPAIANRGYTTQYNKPAPRLQDWKLSEWIEVLARLGHLSPNVTKFGHALRGFRNYVHPASQLASRFAPDEHTARISFHVVVAAAEDLVRASRPGSAPP